MRWVWVGGLEMVLSSLLSCKKVRLSRCTWRLNKKRICSLVYILPGMSESLQTTEGRIISQKNTFACVTRACLSPTRWPCRWSMPHGIRNLLARQQTRRIRTNRLKTDAPLERNYIHWYTINKESRWMKSKLILVHVRYCSFLLKQR